MCDVSDSSGCLLESLGIADVRVLLCDLVHGQTGEHVGDLTHNGFCVCLRLSHVQFDHRVLLCIGVQSQFPEILPHDIFFPLNQVFRPPHVPVECHHEIAVDRYFIVWQAADLFTKLVPRFGGTETLLSFLRPVIMRF